MKRVFVLSLLTLALVAQRTPNKQDIAWACNLDSPHNCQCPAMVAERQDAWIKHCHEAGPVEYEECMAHIPDACDIVQKVDTEHPQHSCKRSCSVAVCRCHDGPMCTGPELK